MFLRELEKINAERLYYLDECGVDHRLYREYGRALPGERLYQEVSGSSRKRTSVVSASQKGKLIAPMIFEGSCTAQVMDAYFEQVLLPELPRGSIIVLDNARFHQSPTTQALVKRFDCELLFLPAYSPDLNPIEHLWAKFKKLLRPKLASVKNKFSFIAKMSQCLC